MIEQLNLGDCDKENLSDDLENTHVYSFQESNINFWFEDEELSEIQWGPISNFEQPPKIHHNRIRPGRLRASQHSLLEPGELTEA